MSAVIHMQDIRKAYARGDLHVEALRGVSLEVQPGEFVAITGPSGSGKSTLMNILGCLDRPDAGIYQLNGEDITRLGSDALAQARNRTFGFVFQNFGLLPRTSALENVETPLLYAGVARQERRRRAGDLLQKLGLGDRIGHLSNQLSGGQQQRVAIARALVNNPTVLLADEPTGNLDSATGAEIVNLLEQLNRDEGLTIVLITHEAEVAARARRGMMLHDGRLESQT
ncbi:MAG: ABC transporter ATP-binding protein [Pseudomonadota bacterium]|nr:MAG: ABC transporter ATP-binding protein [Pseudomonadota bacterium]